MPRRSYRRRPYRRTYRRRGSNLRRRTSRFGRRRSTRRTYRRRSTRRANQRIFAFKRDVILWDTGFYPQVAPDGPGQAWTFSLALQTTTQPWLAGVAQDIAQYDYFRFKKCTLHFVPLMRNRQIGFQSGATEYAGPTYAPHVYWFKDWDDSVAPTSKFQCLAQAGVKHAVQGRELRITWQPRAIMPLSPIQGSAFGTVGYNTSPLPANRWIGGAGTITGAAVFPGLKTYFESALQPSGAPTVEDIPYRLYLTMRYECKNRFVHPQTSASSDVHLPSEMVTGGTPYIADNPAQLA